MIAGVDVSKWQGKKVDWGKVSAAGNDFAFVKSSEGVGYKDPVFDRNWVAARDAGLLVGAYHFARVSKSPDIPTDARDEADWFTEVMGDLGEGYLPPVLDIEWDKRAKGIKPAEIVHWCTVFLNRLSENTGRMPIVYTGVNYWKYKLMQTPSLVKYPLWLVQYTTRDKPKKPIPVWDYTFWQSSHTLPVDGIPGKGVDQNKFPGMMSELKAMAAVPVEAVVPEPELVAPEVPVLHLASFMSRLIELFVGINARSESCANDKDVRVA